MSTRGRLDRWPTFLNPTGVALVGPSSGGKTELVQSIGGLPEVENLSLPAD